MYRINIAIETRKVAQNDMPLLNNAVILYRTALSKWKMLVTFLERKINI